MEFSEPSFGPLRWLNRLYCHRIMPLTASLIARDRSGAYRYLPRSIETFLSASELASLVEQAGLRVVRQVHMTLGVCVATLAVRDA